MPRLAWMPVAQAGPTSRSSRLLRLELSLDRSDPRQRKPVMLAGGGKPRPNEAARQHDLPCPHHLAAFGETPGEPHERLERMAQDLPPLPAVDMRPVLLDDALNRSQVRPFGDERPEDGPGVPGVVGDQRENIEIAIIRMAVLDQFEGRTDRRDPLAHLGDVP